MTYNSIPSSNIVDISPPAIRSPKTFVMGGSLKTLTQLIKSLFANYEQGFAYDPNDLTTLYQDAAGTIPVTAAGQPVGLMKDKSGRNNHAYQTTSAARPILRQMSILGTELVVNGGFSAGLANWVQQGTAVSSVTAGVLRITAQGSTSGVYQDIPTIVGRTYELDFRSTGNLLVQLYANSGFSPTIPNSNTPRMTFVATSSVTRLYAYCNGSSNGTIDNISLKHFTGYRTDQNYLKFDAVDDKLITNLPTQLTGCTVVRSVPNVGTQILTGQTIPTPYNDNIDNCGLIVINRALTASETSQITKLFNKAAGV